MDPWHRSNEQKVVLKPLRVIGCPSACPGGQCPVLEVPVGSSASERAAATHQFSADDDTCPHLLSPVSSPVT